MVFSLAITVNSSGGAGGSGCIIFMITVVVVAGRNYRFTTEPNQEKAWHSHTQTTDFVTSSRRAKKCTDVTAPE